MSPIRHLEWVDCVEMLVSERVCSSLADRPYGGTLSDSERSLGVTGHDVIEMALFLGACLGALYLTAKMKAFVRAETDRGLAARKQETDKLLEDYKREGEKLLEAVQAEQRRQSDELGLFTRERYRAYPRVYRQYRVAGDAWIRAAKTADAAERERRLKTARRRVTLAKRTEIKEDLYLSDAVRDYVAIARQHVAAYSAQVITHQPSAASKVLLKKESAMERRSIDSKT